MGTDEPFPAFSLFFQKKVAETEGFEPSVREFPVRRFSKPLVSATHPRLRVRPLRRKAGYISANPKLQPERAQLFRNDLKTHVEAHGFSGIEHAHSKFAPLAFGRVEGRISVRHGLGHENSALSRRVDLEELRL